MQVTVKNLRNEEQVTFELPYFTSSDLKEQMSKIGIEVDEFDDLYIGDEELEQGKDFAVLADFTDEDLNLKDLPETLRDLEELAEFLEQAGDTEKDVFLTMVKDMGKDTSDAMYDVNKSNYIYYDCCSDRELAEEVIDQCYGSIEEMPKEVLARYFDFEAYGNDLKYDLYETHDGRYMQEC